MKKNKGDRNFMQNLLSVSLVIKTYAIFLFYIYSKKVEPKSKGLISQEVTDKLFVHLVPPSLLKVEMLIHLYHARKKEWVCVEIWFPQDTIFRKMDTWYLMPLGFRNISVWNYSKKLLFRIVSFTVEMLSTGSVWKSRDTLDNKEHKEFNEEEYPLLFF